MGELCCTLKYLVSSGGLWQVPSVTGLVGANCKSCNSSGESLFAREEQYY